MSERIVIARLKKREFSQRRISEILGVHASTISRELKRNGHKGVYKAFMAKEKARERRFQAKYVSRKVEHSRRLQKLIAYYRKKYYSPEQIAGRLKLRGIYVSHPTIYRYLYRTHGRDGTYLRHQKKRRVYGTKRAKQTLQEAKKKRIDQRPTHIDTRKHLGDFEGDTIVLGGRKQRLLTLVDRKSGFLLMKKLVPRIKGVSDLVHEETKKFSNMYPLKSLTFDNGTEFSLHKMIENDVCPVYFAYPYHSWERGTSENTNGLVRQFFPKKMSGDSITGKAVSSVQDLLNHRPRKRLHYLTPFEVFVLKMKPVHFRC